MNAERIGSLALRTYPSEFRAVRGEEMLGTLLDAGEDSTAAFVKGCGSLLIGGLAERARSSVQVGTRRLVEDGFCLAAVLWSVYWLTSQAYWQTIEFPTWTLALAAAVPVFALWGRDRLAGLCGMALASYFLLRGYDVGHLPGQLVAIGHPSQVFLLDRWLGPLVCFAAMVLKPRIRDNSTRRMAWLIPVAVIGVLWPPAVALLVLIGAPLLGIVLLPIDPRLAIASALVWIDVAAASTLGHVRLGLVTFPVLLLTILIADTRVRAVRRKTFPASRRNQR